MQSHRINHLPTTQGESAFLFQSMKEHDVGKGSIVVPVKLPKNMHVDGFPVESYSVAVTPSQPCCASVSNQTRYGFDVTLTSLNGGSLAKGSFTVLVVG